MVPRASLSLSFVGNQSANPTTFGSSFDGRGVSRDLPSRSSTLRNRVFGPRAMATLPVPFREVLVLREIHGLDYRAIAEIAELPIGTVMSRLARARRKLLEAVCGDAS